MGWKALQWGRIGLERDEIRGRKEMSWEGWWERDEWTRLGSERDELGRIRWKRNRFGTIGSERDELRRIGPERVERLDRIGMS